MTVDLALNRKDQDIQFKVNANGFAELFLIDGADRILQKIRIALQMWYGEWFLDLTKGVPYLEVIFVKQTRQSTIESILRSKIMGVDGVRRILDFSFKPDAQTRRVTVDFVCETTEGRVIGSAVLDQAR